PLGCSRSGQPSAAARGGRKAEPSCVQRRPARARRTPTSAPREAGRRCSRICQRRSSVPSARPSAFTAPLAGGSWTSKPKRRCLQTDRRSERRPESCGLPTHSRSILLVYDRKVASKRAIGASGRSAEKSPAWGAVGERRPASICGQRGAAFSARSSNDQRLPELLNGARGGTRHPDWDPSPECQVRELEEDLLVSRTLPVPNFATRGAGAR